MAGYTYQELMQMQNDAIKRVEEMQKKARTTAGLDNSSQETKKSPEMGDKRDEPRHVPMPEGYLKKQEQPQRDNPPKHTQPKTSFNLKLGNGDIEIDSDKALLLSLILLLAEEQADELMLTALVYMLG